MNKRESKSFDQQENIASLQETIKQLKSDIEKMKNCYNCKHQDGEYCSACIFPDDMCQSDEYHKWEPWWKK